jgi:hypothetical protein
VERCGLVVVVGFDLVFSSGPSCPSYECLVHILACRKHFFIPPLSPFGRAEPAKFRALYETLN